MRAITEITEIDSFHTLMIESDQKLSPPQVTEPRKIVNWIIWTCRLSSESISTYNWPRIIMKCCRPIWMTVSRKRTFEIVHSTLIQPTRAHPVTRLRKIYSEKYCAEMKNHHKQGTTQNWLGSRSRNAFVRMYKTCCMLLAGVRLHITQLEMILWQSRCRYAIARPMRVDLFLLCVV